MKIDEKDVLEVKTRAELRGWLSSNYKTAKQCWVYYSLKPKEGKLLYLDLVEEALCFGWIDGIGKSYHGSLIRRLTPRKPKSRWSELNRARVKRLTKLGLMKKEGLACVPADNFEIDPQVMDALKTDPLVYQNFKKFPKLYQRVRIDTIQDALRNNHQSTFQKRLDKFILNTKFNLMYGDWNDFGRLL